MLHGDISFFYVKHKGIKCFMDSSSTFISLWPLNWICLFNIQEIWSHKVLFWSNVFIPKCLCVCQWRWIKADNLCNFSIVCSVYFWTDLFYTSKLSLVFFFNCLNFQQLADYTNVVSLKIGLLILLIVCFEEPCLFHFPKK